MDLEVTREDTRIASFVAGIVILCVAAFLSISILLAVFPLPYAVALVGVPGDILFSVYGFSSFLVPCLLLYASILLLIPGWTIRSGILLAGSVFPFFTVVAAERLYCAIARPIMNPSVGRLVGAGIAVSAALSVMIEYLLLLHLGDRLVRRASPAPLHADDTIEAEAEADADAETEAAVDADAETEANLEANVGFGNDSVMYDAAAGDGGSPIRAEDDAASSLPEAPSTVPPSSVRESVPTSDLEFINRGVPPSAGSAPSAADATPMYVDFEKMKAPFDLPVIEDWVEPSQSPSQSVPGEIPESGDDAETLAEFDEDDNNDEFSVESADDDEDAGIGYSRDDDVAADSALIDGLAFDRGDGTEVEVPSAYLSDDEDMPDIDDGDDILADDREYEVEDVDSPLADPIGESAATDAPVPDDGLPPVLTVPPQAPSAESESAVSEGEAPGLAARLFAKRQRRLPYAVPYDILTSYPDGEYWIIDDTTRRAAAALKETLNEFRIQADVTGIRKGPVITMFEILPAPGVKLSKIVGLQDNIALRLAASSVRIVAPIPGKHAVGIEVPNQKRSIVSFRELIEADIPSAKKMEIPVVLGKDITGEAQLLDLASTPHLLIAGSTGSGKSVCVNSIILSILYKRSPEEVKLILIDPKIVELKLYNDIAHLLAPVITEPKKAFQALQYCLCEMERRYALLDGMGVRDIKSYNKRIKERNIATEKLPYIVIIIDEFADLMATTGKELESTVARLCAMSRAVGIHLVLATQRPSIDVITGLIKANIPTRIAFMVASKMDSRIIIDQVGAEKLLGRGDMLYAGAVDPFPVRIQGAFVSEEEVERVVEHVKTLGEPEYIDEEMFVEDDEDEILDQSLFSDGEDPLYDKALEIVLLAGKASASYIQRKLKIGYNRAARLVEDMEARGIVGPANGSKPREVVHHP